MIWLCRDRSGVSKLRRETEAVGGVGTKASHTGHREEARESQLSAESATL